MMAEPLSQLAPRRGTLWLLALRSNHDPLAGLVGPADLSCLAVYARRSFIRFVVLTNRFEVAAGMVRVIDMGARASLSGVDSCNSVKHTAQDVRAWQHWHSMLTANFGIASQLSANELLATCLDTDHQAGSHGLFA